MNEIDDLRSLFADEGDEGNGETERFNPYSIEAQLSEREENKTPRPSEEARAARDRFEQEALEKDLTSFENSISKLIAEYLLDKSENNADNSAWEKLKDNLRTTLEKNELAREQFMEIISEPALESLKDAINNKVQDTTGEEDFDINSFAPAETGSE